jgi:4-amino-4-deoxy-L-arabinose transferase-like glycosyltransferase
MDIRATLRRSVERPWALLTLLLALVLSVIVTNPFGEFAVNDDWFYYWSVYGFHWSNFKLDSLITPSLMGQVFYGHALVKIFGFSFTLLRLSTIILAAVGTFFFYRLLLRIGLSRGAAVLSSSVLWFNPIFFFLSFSFMTDVPALVFVMIATYFFWRWHQGGSRMALVAALLFTIYAYLIRQSYALVLLAVAVLVFWPHQGKKRDWWSMAIYLMSLLAAFGLKLWLTGRGWWPTNDVSLHSFENLPQVASNFYQQLYYVWHYLALFLAPVTIIFFVRLDSARRWRGILSGLASVALGLALYAYYGLVFPYFGNVISVYGLGPRQPNLTLAGAPTPLLVPLAAFVLTVIVSFVAGVSLYLLISGAWRLLKERAFGEDFRFSIFLAVNIVTQFGVVALFVGFDRYYLSLLFFTLVLLALVGRNQKTRAVSWVLLALFAVISIVGTSSYLRENALKWQLANDLVARGEKITQVDGGYEWLGWNWYKKGNPTWLPYYDPSKPWYITSLFPDVLRNYVISYDAMSAGYRLVGVYSYPRPLLGTGELYLLKSK